MRKLASIKTISELHPIKDKDRIELALIDGWQIIVKKEEFKIGDKTIFVEIDSVLPDKPEFEFLRSKKFRIKTMKMAGLLSQGICFPLSTLPEGDYEIDQDVTDLMGIIKYEPYEDSGRNREPNIQYSKKFNHPIFKLLFRYSLIRKLFLPRKQNKGFPEFISKTDETRLQNIPFILKNKGVKYIVREKIDGQSGSFFLEKMNKKWFWQKQSYDFGVCSRNLRLWNKDSGSQWFVAKKYDIENVLKDLIGDNKFVAIQGECVSPKVQGNKYKVSEPDLYAFNLIYPGGKMLCIDAEELLKKYNIKWCPLADDSFTLLDTVNELLDYSTGKSVLYNTLREGYVFRNYVKNTSFKAVSPKFLIKHDE